MRPRTQNQQYALDYFSREGEAATWDGYLQATGFTSAQGKAQPGALFARGEIEIVPKGTLALLQKLMPPPEPETPEPEAPDLNEVESVEIKEDVYAGLPNQELFEELDAHLHTILHVADKNQLCRVDGFDMPAGENTDYIMTLIKGNVFEDRNRSQIERVMTRWPEYQDTDKFIGLVLHIYAHNQIPNVQALLPTFESVTKSKLEYAKRVLSCVKGYVATAVLNTSYFLEAPEREARKKAKREQEERRQQEQARKKAEQERRKQEYRRRQQQRQQQQKTTAPATGGVQQEWATLASALEYELTGDLKRDYKAMASRCHPDKAGENPTAKTMFTRLATRLNNAYDILKK